MLGLSAASIAMAGVCWQISLLATETLAVEVNRGWSPSPNPSRSNSCERH